MYYQVPVLWPLQQKAFYKGTACTGRWVQLEGHSRQVDLQVECGLLERYVHVSVQHGHGNDHDHERGDYDPLLAF